MNESNLFERIVISYFVPKNGNCAVITQWKQKRIQDPLFICKRKLKAIGNQIHHYVLVLNK